MSTGQIINGLAMAAAVLVASGRIYLRIFREKRYALEEFLIIGSVVLYMVLGGMQAHMLALFDHLTDPANAIEVKTYFAFVPYVYNSTLYCTKMAIIRFHLQLTENFWVHKWARYTMWLIMGFWVLQYILYSVGCLPFDRRWSLDPTTACNALVNSWDFWVTWAMHIGTDLLLVAIPFPALARIKDLKLRLAISGIYALGAVGITTSTIRIIFMATDPEKSLERTTILSTIETSVHIMVATIPGISGTFIKRYRNRSTNKGSSSSQMGPGVYAGASRIAKSKTRNGAGGSVIIGDVTPQDVELESSVGGGSSPFGASTDDIVHKR